MALPGLQMNNVPVLEEKTAATTELQQNSEWRFEVAFGETVEVKVSQLPQCILYIDAVSCSLYLGQQNFSAQNWPSTRPTYSVAGKRRSIHGTAAAWKF